MRRTLRSSANTRPRTAERSEMAHTGQTGQTSSSIASASASPLADQPRPHIQVCLPPANMDPTVEHRLKFYDRDFVPKEKVCPFSPFGRTNPCTSHATPKSRKDLIQHHLENVRRKGGDSSHPLEDPLWQSDVVQHYWLASRPEKTEDPIVMKIAASKASAKSYQRRKDRQDKEEPALKS